MGVTKQLFSETKLLLITYFTFAGCPPWTHSTKLYCNIVCSAYSQEYSYTAQSEEEDTCVILWDSEEEEEEEVLVIPTRQQPVSQVEAMQVRKKNKTGPCILVGI